MEKPIRALEVTLGSSTDMNLGYNNTKFYNNVWGNLGTFKLYFPMKWMAPDSFQHHFQYQHDAGDPELSSKLKSDKIH